LSSDYSFGSRVLIRSTTQPGEQQREQITQAALELMPGELLGTATATGAELEGITAVLLLTGEDDFNALAAAILTGNAQATIYRLAPRQPGHGVVAPFTSGQTIFAPA
jgi:hypothetical protein